jgi:pimeloyl-ACP methyl ester carboxylesterase
MLRMLRRRPLTLLLSLADGQLLRMFATPERCRDAFFSRHTPEDLVARYMQLLTNESMRAAIDMLVTNRPRPERTHTVPMLVLGASDDGLFSADQIHATAARYHTTATIVDTTGHDMMLETTWRTTAQIINTWLKAQFELI